jgi:hypothetical protein
MNQADSPVKFRRFTEYNVFLFRFKILLLPLYALKPDKLNGARFVVKPGSKAGGILSMLRAGRGSIDAGHSITGFGIGFEIIFAFQF